MLQQGGWVRVNKSMPKHVATTTQYL